jgi:tetratricopeptide (TPR) repeat protein
MAVQIFLSCVTGEFGALREPLRKALKLPDADVAIQEDFKALGGDTLEKLEEYIRHCQLVLHVLGETVGSSPPDLAVQALLRRRSDLAAVLPPLGAAIAAGAEISYTHWEAWLALYFGRKLLIAAPEGAPLAAQADHLARLKALDRHVEIRFAGADQLVAQAFPALIEALKEAGDSAPRPNNLPYASLGPLFKGRDEALGELRAALAGGGHTAALVGRALHGLGGVGKTRLAIEFALQHASNYTALLFVGADSPEKLNANLAALAGPAILDLPEKDAPQDEVKIPAALNWLDAHPTWLMILDNVDDAKAVAAVDELLARLRGGHVIVTARASEFPAHLRTLELGTLDAESSTQFLLERTEGKRVDAPDDAIRAHELADELGGLALGLEHAGAYIARQRIGFARYLTLWREKRETVLKWFDRTLMSYDHDVGLAATWAASVEKLTLESRRLLDRLAFLAPDPIPDSLLDVAVPGETADWDPYEARAGLFAYSLISRASGEGAAGQGFAMHRLVQDFARRAMTDERRGEALREALEWLKAAFQGDPQDVRSWPTLEPLAPHALAVARYADSAAITEPMSWLLDRLAGLMLFKARWAEAEPLFRRALAIRETGLGPDHPDVASSLNNLAFLLKSVDHGGEAEPLYRRALAIREASFGPDHPDVAVSLNNLASVLQTTNRLGEAEPLYRRAIAIGEASGARDHPSVAMRFNNLALLLKATNRFGEAEPLFRRALAIDEASYGPDHPEVARDLDNLAILLYDTNRLDEAEPLFRRALAIDEASYGPDHPSVAIRLNNLGEMLRATNRLGDAEPLYRRALAINEASYGPAHPEVATILNNLALLLEATNRLGEAEPLFRRALAIDEASYGPNHPDVARDLGNLALLLKATNRAIEAEPLYRRGLAIDEASYGPDHPSVAIRLNNLACLLRDASRLGEAEPLFHRALAIFEASVGAEHPNTARVRRHIAALESARGSGGSRAG